MKRAHVKKSRGVFYLWVFISCAPLVLLGVLSVSIYWPYPALLPQRVSLDFYRYVFGSHRTLEAIATSLGLGGAAIVLALTAAIPAGKALAHCDFRGKGLVKTLILVPLIVPGVAITIGAQLSMINLGLTGTFLGVAIVHALFALPFAIRIMTNVYEIIGTRLSDQAKVLGAGARLTFLRVTFPQILPGVLSAAALTFTISISQYLTTFMIGGGRVITITILLVPYMQSGQTHIASVYSLLLIAAAVLSLSLIESTLRRRFAGMYYV